MPLGDLGALSDVCANPKSRAVALHIPINLIGYAI
jgi:hypothetical protein